MPTQEFRRRGELEIFTADSQGNPITFNVLELPADMPKGATIQEDVRIAG